MACLLGIEDEPISEAELTDFTVNKVGGKPVLLKHFVFSHFKLTMRVFY